MGLGFEFKQESYDHEEHSSGHNGYGYGYGTGRISPHVKVYAPSRPSYYGNSAMVPGYNHHHHHQGGYSSSQNLNFLGHNSKHDHQFYGGNTNKHGFLGQTMHNTPSNGNMGWSSPHGGQFNSTIGGMRHGGSGGGFFEKKESAYSGESSWSSGSHGGGYPAAEWPSKAL